LNIILTKMVYEKSAGLTVLKSKVTNLTISSNYLVKDQLLIIENICINTKVMYLIKILYNYNTYCIELKQIKTQCLVLY